MNAFYFLYENGINLMPLCMRLVVFSSRHSGNLFALLMFATFEFVQTASAFTTDGLWLLWGCWCCGCWCCDCWCCDCWCCDCW